MAKIFITGITGFLGSNIAEYLIQEGHTITAIYRKASSKKRCASFEKKIDWILQDENDWFEQVIEFKPEIIIHSAWLGVEHNERNLWEVQLTNIDFIKQILFIAKKVNAQKFISLGSQAEYGIFDGCITEQHPLNPTEAYGCVKVICTELVKQFCTSHNINWFWLRLFSFFGKGQSDEWLIPNLVNKLLTTNQMDFTPGEQKYAYLYVDHLATAVNNIIKINGPSGIYNISGKHLISLKDLITNIRDQINPSFVLNFSKLEYRRNQPMWMQGDVSKFISQFGEFELSGFEESLTLTVGEIKKNFKSN